MLKSFIGISHFTAQEGSSIRSFDCQHLDLSKCVEVLQIAARTLTVSDQDESSEV